MMGSNQDSINISWHIDDIKSVNSDLTDDQCRKILGYLLDNYDSSVGINWDVIKTTIDIYIERLMKNDIQ